MLLCLTMLGCSMTAFPITANGEEQPAGTPISTVEEFLAMNPSGEYYLASDIDFSGKTYTKNLYTQNFSGVLDGNGHALLGITVSATNSDAGIFANGFHGTLKNLTFGSANAPVSVTSTGGGYSVAAMAGTMTGGATFDNVRIYANVKGDGKTAGFTSYMPNGKITITNCAVYGTVIGNPASGFLTMSNDGSCDVEIRDSANYADVTAQNASAGGFYSVAAATNGSRKTNMIITGCINYGSISATDWRVGGIVGEFNEEKTSSITIDYCYNMGFVTMKGGGGYAAGIVGGLSFDPSSGTRKISNVYNAGTVTNSGNPQRAYALCSSDKTSNNLSIVNGAYLAGSASNANTPCNNITATNVKEAADAAELLAIVSEYAPSAEGNVYIRDTALMNEGYPILARQALAHENVTTFDCGRKLCNDCHAIISSPEEENHTFEETSVQPDGYVDGYVIAVCSACGEEVLRAGTPSTYHVTPVDGVYSIASPDALKWYAANLNAGLLSGKESLKLAADLDLGGTAFTPIGTKKNPFCGMFDGDFHSIKGLKVTSDNVGGLFGYVGRGAVFTNLEFASAVITAKGSAGALFGEAVNASVVTVENIALIGASVTSTEGAAGSLFGSCEFAIEVKATAVVSNKAVVNGVTAGGLIGNGNNAILKSAYVNANLTATDKTKVGSLAYYNGRFSATHSYYVRNQVAGVTNGTVISEEWFANGKAAYQLNAFENNFVFSVKDGATTLSKAPIRMVRLGGTKVYTDKTLSPKDKMAVYATEVTGGVAVAFVIDPASKVRLYDLAITVKDGDKTQTVTFADLTHDRALVVGDDYYTIENGMVLYTVTLDGVSANATYTVGSIFSGTADILR
ncbi:MAG: hypothetical protein J6S34_04615 [Clostridia bacterium]|nr:hypothetical protein [Clostridia bacterium]